MAKLMFEFVTKTWNPLGGRCSHGCVYGWCRRLIEQKPALKVKYAGKPYLVESELKRSFAVEEFVFVQDMTDLCAADVPYSVVLQVLDVIRKSKATFLILTKNANVLLKLVEDGQVPGNVVLGVTCESNLNHWPGAGGERFYQEFSKAPSPSWRLLMLRKIARICPVPLFVAVEPALDFHETDEPDHQCFSSQLIALKPWAVAVGFDNYGCELPEPSLAKAQLLISRLEAAGVKVYRKTLREAWNN